MSFRWWLNASIFTHRKTENMKPASKSLGALVAASLLCGPMIAHSAITFISYGTALPTGESLITDFSTAAGLTGGNLVTGSVSGVSAAPAFSATTADPNQYLSVPGGGPATLTFAPTKTVSVYVGSLDTYNTLSFGGPGATVFTGSALGAVSGAANGNQTAANTNGRFVFTFANAVDSLNFSSSSNAFEVADVATGSVPEPATWALMLIGVAGMGAALRASRRRAPFATI